LAFDQEKKKPALVRPPDGVLLLIRNFNLEKDSPWVVRRVRKKEGKKVGREEPRTTTEERKGGRSERVIARGRKDKNRVPSDKRG